MNNQKTVKKNCTDLSSSSWPHPQVDCCTSKDIADRFHPTWKILEEGKEEEEEEKVEVNLNVSHLINIKFFHDECCILLCLLFQFGELVGRCTQHNDLQRKRKITQVYSLRISSGRLKACIAIRQRRSRRRRRRRRRRMMTRGKPKDKAHRSSTHSMEFKDVEDLEVFKEKGSFCLHIPLSLLPLLCVHQHSCHKYRRRFASEYRSCCQ
jgi:hypothetical protein